LKNAGVDMNSLDPILAVTNKMSKLVDELEKLI
jgi:oligoendopeptidase F